MKRGKRVIAVEDDRNLLATYIDVLRREGYEVHGAENLPHALTLIGSYTYDAALVDLQLNEDDENNRDGLRVLEYLKVLDEGTTIVVCSGQDTREVFVEVYENHAISHYIVKPASKYLAFSEHLHADGVIEKDQLKRSDIVNPVNRAADRFKLREYGPYTTAAEFLSGSTPTPKWEYDCLQFLKPAGGIKGLYSFFTAFLHGYTPLLPLKTAPIPLIIERDGSARGVFWSKGLGKAIRIMLLPPGQQFAGGDGDARVIETTARQLVGVVMDPGELDRSLFVERLTKQDEG